MVKVGKKHTPQFPAMGLNKLDLSIESNVVYMPLVVLRHSLSFCDELF